MRLEAAKADVTHQNAVLRAKKNLRDALKTALAVDDRDGDSDADSVADMGADKGSGSYGYGSP